MPSPPPPPGTARTRPLFGGWRPCGRSEAPRWPRQKPHGTHVGLAGQKRPSMPPDKTNSVRPYAPATTATRSRACPQRSLPRQAPWSSARRHRLDRTRCGVRPRYARADGRCDWVRRGPLSSDGHVGTACRHGAGAPACGASRAGSRHEAGASRSIASTHRRKQRR